MLWFEEKRRKIFRLQVYDCLFGPLPGNDYELGETQRYDHGPYVIGDGYAHVALVLLI